MLSRKRLALIVVLALIVMCGGFIHSLFLGRDIPTAVPDARRRTSHPLGFSIIVPPNWSDQIRTDSVGLVTQGVYLAPKSSWPPRRYNATLSVSLSDPRERNRDSDVLMPTAFQGQPAISSTTTRDIGDGVPAFSYTLHFQRDDRWFRIRYNVFDSISELPPSVATYINSFEYRRPRCLLYTSPSPRD